MNPEFPELWTVEQFAQAIRVTEEAARCMLRRRELPAEAVVKIGRRVRLRVDVVRAWLLRNPAA